MVIFSVIKVKHEINPTSMIERLDISFTSSTPALLWVQKNPRTKLCVKFCSTNIIVYHCNFVQSSLKWRLRLFFHQCNSPITIRLPLLKTLIRLSWTSISLINLKIKLWVTLVDWNGNFGKWSLPGNVTYFGSSFALPQEICLIQFVSSIEDLVADFTYYYCSIFSIKTSSKFASSVG